LENQCFEKGEVADLAVAFPVLSEKEVLVQVKACGI
jgi:hypothetical protein